MRCFSCSSVSCLAALISAAAPAAAQPLTPQIGISGLLDASMFRGFDGHNQVGTIQRSHLALAGTEDLGAGLKATFRLSTRFDLDTGLPEDAGQKPFWHDESTVGLQGAWGHVRLGRALSAMWSQDWKFDPWGNFNRIASPAWSQWHYLTPTDPYSNNGSAEYGRLANGLFYDAPAVGGWTLRLSASPERQRVPAASGKPQGRGYSAALNYDQGPLAAMLAFERNSLGDKDRFVAGKYRFGAAALMAAYDDSRTGDGIGRSRAFTLGATYRVGVVTLKAGYGRQRYNGHSHHFASTGVDYVLSQRSTLYVSLGHKNYQNERIRTALGVGFSHAF